LSTCSYWVLEAKEALRKDEGHEMTSRPGHVRSEDGRTKDRRRRREVRKGICGQEEKPYVILFSGCGGLAFSSAKDNEEEEEEEGGRGR
jgi:hypothetical protein